MHRSIRCLLPLVCFSAFLGGGELAPPTAAKFIRLMLLASGGGKVGCPNDEIARELVNLGVVIDKDAKMTWAVSDKSVSSLARQGRMVICGDSNWLALGASVAVTAEGGRPCIHLSMKNLSNSGVTLPDNIVKISKVEK